MKFFSCLIIVLFFCVSNFCTGRSILFKKELSQTNLYHQEKNDSTFPYFIGKHPVLDKQSLYFEIFGNSANYYSLNYERCIFLRSLHSDKWIRFSLRFGINHADKKFALPIMIHFSHGTDRCFEAGAGWVPWLSDTKRVDGIAVFSGLRYQNRSGLMARFGVAPTYLIQEKDHLRMIFGFSFGYAF